MATIVAPLLADATLYSISPHITYTVTYQGRKAMLKLYYDPESFGNEVESIMILHHHDPRYPAIIFMDRSQPWILSLEGREYRILQSLCYEYIPDIPLGVLTLRDMRDLQQQLDDIHSLGLNYGNVHVGNIIRRIDDGKAFFIDYGKAYTYSIPALPKPTGATADSLSLLR